MKKAPTLTEIRAALKKIAAQKNRPDYELTVAKMVRTDIELGRNQPLALEVKAVLQSQLDAAKSDIKIDLKSSKRRNLREYATDEEHESIADFLYQLKVVGVTELNFSEMSGVSPSAIWSVKKKHVRLTKNVFLRLNAARERILLERAA